MATPPATASSSSPVADLPALSRQWQALRQQRGHFDGAAWNDDVDRFGGARHRVMRELSQALLDQHARATEVARHLGPPDLRIKPGSALHARALQELTAPCTGGTTPGASDELLAYSWRGRHDLLLLWAPGGRLGGCGWLSNFE